MTNIHNEYTMKTKEKRIKIPNHSVCEALVKAEHRIAKLEQTVARLTREQLIEQAKAYMISTYGSPKLGIISDDDFCERLGELVMFCHHLTKEEK